MRHDLVSLDLFVCVAECGNLTRAAERRHLAVSAVSKRISELEALIGTPLLVRQPRGVRLTPAGQSLLHHARQMLQLVARMDEELGAYAGGLKGHVRMQAVASALTQFLPEELRDFLVAHPGVQVSVEERTGRDIVRAVQGGAADLGFFAIDPLRAQHIAFTAPHVLIEGCHLVREDSPLRSNDEVDAPGRVVVVGRGSAYDLHLTRTLRHARIERAPTSPAVVDCFMALGAQAEVAAGVRQQLEADAARLGGLRLLPEPFMVIRQAMGLPRDRGEPAAAALADFVERMKASGFVAAALARHRIEGARVAPAGSRSDC